VLPNVQTDILLTVFPNPYFLADPITTCVLIEANEIRQNANNLIRSGHHQLIIKSNRRRKQISLPFEEGRIALFVCNGLLLAWLSWRVRFAVGKRKPGTEIRQNVNIVKRRKH
jgi:hypothetical protein